MARRVAIIGTGMTKCGTSTVPSWVLFADAAVEAIKEAGLKVSEIEAVHLGNVHGQTIERQGNMSALALSLLGVDNNIPCTRYEAACCSASVAFRQGFFNVLGGMNEIVLVGGTELLRSASGPVVQEALSRGMDKLQRDAGLTYAAYWAYVAKSYARKYGLSLDRLQELLAEVSVKNHYHGSFNRLAQFQKQITVAEVLNSPVVSPPIKLLDSCPFTDGAAALVLASEGVARNHPNPVWIEGSGQASGKFQVYERDDLSFSPGMQRAIDEAYRQAGMGPKDIDIAELHDCTNINEVIQLEQTGFFPKGQGIYAAAERKTYFDGEKPVNCSGGLKTRGHPIGATGAYQLSELTRELRGNWQGKRPTNNPKVGMTLNSGGGGIVITTHILRKG